MPIPTYTWRRLMPIGAMAFIACLLPPLGGLLILGTLPIVGPWLQSQQWIGLVLYIAVFVFLAGLAVLPTYAQAILGGWAFGFALGFPTVMCGFLGASLLAHQIARHVAGERLTGLFENRPAWRRIYHALVISGFWRTTWIIILLRIPPTSPFALSNVLLASARVPTVPFLLGSCIGLAPRTAVAVFAGSELSNLTLDQRIFECSEGVILFTVATTVLALILLGLAARKSLQNTLASSTVAHQDSSCTSS